MEISNEGFAEKALLFAFLLMGFSFSVTQALMARELLVSFAGNELSIGLVLGSWLILEALGSGFLGRLAERVGARAPSYAALQLAFALLLPLSLYAAFTVRRIVGTVPGEGLSLVSILHSSFLILTPLGLVDGAMFTFGCKAYSHLVPKEIRSIGNVYVLEAIGGIAGGLVFTYLFIPHLHAVQVILVLAALNLASAASLLVLSPDPKAATPRARLAIVLALLAASLGLLLSPQADAIHRWMAHQQWRGYDLAFYRNSIYGNIAVIRQEEQYTFFANGIPILTTPVPDITLVEELVHLPMLFVPQPRRVLVVSGGVGGVLNEILKYPVERVDYAELDPLLIEAVRDLPTPLTARELADPRVRIEHVDGRLLVKRKGWEAHPGYDLIVLNLPYPSTLQLNRFYTEEFFDMARAILDEKGVLVLLSPGTLTYMSPAMRNLNAAIYQTLREAFPHVRPIPGDVNLWLASPGQAVEEVPLEELVRRWEERAVPASLLTEFHIRYKFDEQRLAWFWDSLLDGEEVEVNRDLRPSGLLHGLAYWNELFSPRFSGYFELLERLSLPLLGLPLAALTLALLAARKLSSKLERAPIPMAIVTTGFGGMACDLLVIFAFQAFYGYVYYQIGLLITAFMAGLSLGGLVMSRLAERAREDKPLLLKLEGALVAYWVLFPAVLALLYSQARSPLVSAAVGPTLLVLNAIGGFLVGMEFPLANKMYLRRSLSETAGVLYASDLVGAFLGALLVSVALLPALGIVETCLLVALLKVGSLALVATLPKAARRL